MISFIKIHKVTILICALVTAIGVGLVFRSRHTASDQLSSPLKRGSISESVYGIGTVTANRSFQLKSGISATVVQLFVREGDQVKRGQKLATLGEGVSFSAPFDGTITSIPVKVGENVFPQTAILEVVDLTDRYVVVSLEQRAAIKVRRGQTAQLSFENLREVPYKGQVESVYSHQTNFLVRIDAPTLPQQVLPGMTADVAIEINVRNDVLLVPVAAIENNTVQVKRGAHLPATIPLTIGAVDGAMAEVLAGDLKEGDRLVIRKKARS